MDRNGTAIRPNFTIYRQHGMVISLAQHGITRTVIAVMVGLLAGVAAMVVVAAPAIADETTAEQTEARERGMQTLLGFVSASNLNLEQRRDAARTLLDKRWPEADQALAELIAANRDGTTTRAIAQALARRLPPPPPLFAEPLLDAIAASEGERIDDLAQAVGRIEDRDVIDRITQLARDDEAPLEARRAAILALAVQRTKANAATLIAIMRSGPPEPVAAAVFESLARLTGIREYGDDRDRWLAWWRRIQHATEAHWYASLIEHHARRNAELADSATRLERQLLSARRQLFWATPAPQRQALLARLLEDEMEATRRLALELAGQLLLTPGLIGSELREALVASLADDHSAAVRRGAAELLADLVDADAAQIVAERLNNGSEADPAVRASYLLLLERVPVAEAIEPIIELLEDQVARDRAAAALVRAFDADKMNQPLALRVRQKVDGLIEANGGTPRPRLIELLARVGGDEDWERIVSWLDHEEATVRRAAAQALADSRRSLLPLAERSDDPEVRGVFYTAARTRGRDPHAFAALVRHRPEGESQREAWRSALVAMAGRVGPQAVLDAVASLGAEELADPEQRRIRRSLKLDMLRIAIEALRPEDRALSALSEQEQGQWAGLMLARGQVLLASDRAADAASDMRRIAELLPLLSAAQRRQRELCLIGAKLQTESPTAALDRARELLRSVDDEAAPGYRIELFDVFVTATTRLAAAERHEQARRVYDRLKLLMDGQGDDGQIVRLSELEQLLPPPAPPRPRHPGPPDAGDRNQHRRCRRAPGWRPLPRAGPR